MLYSFCFFLSDMEKNYNLSIEPTCFEWITVFVLRPFKHILLFRRAVQLGYLVEQDPCSVGLVLLLRHFDFLGSSVFRRHFVFLRHFVFRCYFVVLARFHFRHPELFWEPPYISLFVQFRFGWQHKDVFLSVPAPGSFRFPIKLCF